MTDLDNKTKDETEWCGEELKKPLARMVIYKEQHVATTFRSDIKIFKKKKKQKKKKK